MNKILLMLVLMICFSCTAFAQESVVDSLRKEIESLEDQINEKNYTCVPIERVCNSILANENHIKNKTFIEFVTEIMQDNANKVHIIQGNEIC